MRKLTFLSAMLLLAMTVGAQDRPGNTSVNLRALKTKGVKVVNKFQLAVKKLKECPLFDIAGTLELFSDEAIIEVSSLTSNKHKPMKPDAYFRTVNALRCNFDPLYLSMSFDYLPVSENNAQVSSLNGSYVFSYNITQIFKGRKSKGTTYCDITIKTVRISFIIDDQGIWQPKIIGILVEETNKCNV